MTSERIQKLVQIFWNEINSSEDFRRFLANYESEICADLFEGLLESIYNEDNAIRELLENSVSNKAYSRAVSNFKRTQYFRDNGIEIAESSVECAFTLARSAMAHFPPKYDEAIASYQIAAEQALKVNDKHSYAATQNNLGHLYYDLPTGAQDDHLCTAISHYENALEIYTETEFPQYYAMIHRNLGNVYSKLQIGKRETNLRHAITCYERALSIFTTEKFPQDYANIQLNLGNVYRDLPKGNRVTNLRQAITCYERALSIFTIEKFPQDYANTQLNSGIAYYQLPTGDRTANLRHAIYCFDCAQRIFPEDGFVYEYMMTQMHLGNAYSDLLTGKRDANLHQAIDCYKNSLRGSKFILGHGMHRDFSYYRDVPQIYALTGLNLGNAYRALLTGNRETNMRQAITCYQYALSIFTETTFPREHALTQMNLGNAYRDLPKEDQKTNLRQAITCYECALSIFAETTFPREYALTQMNLANAYRDIPKEDRETDLYKAINCYKHALHIFTEAMFPWERVLGLFNLTLAYNSAPINDLQQAYHTCAEAIQILEAHIRAVSSVETNFAIAKNQVKIYQQMVSLCICLNKVEEAFNYAERNKSRTLVEVLHAVQLEPSDSVPEGVRKTFLDVKKRLNELYNLEQMGEREWFRNFKIDHDDRGQLVFHEYSFDDFRSEASRNHKGDIVINLVPIWQLIKELQQGYQELIKHIRDLDPEFALAGQVRSISIRETRQMVPERTLFVECFTGHDGTYIFIIDGKTQVSEMMLLLRDLTEAEILDTLVIANWLAPYHKFRQNSSLAAHQEWLNTFEETLQLIASRFWHAEDEHGTSLANCVEQNEVERIVFIPYGCLHLLPLHLIPLEAGVRLMDRYEISYTPSATLLQIVLQRERNDYTHLLALANPDGSLKFADIEIAEHFDNQKILWGKNATSEALFSAAKEANIIHFISHGEFGKDDPMESNLLLARNVDAVQKYYKSGGIYPHPTYPEAEEDDLTSMDEMAEYTFYGRLFKETRALKLREIFARLKLPNTAIVVLSACETGMVELERGDEYIGLPSGFLYAGASTVISSLWAVDDLSTAILMNRWYEDVLQKKMGKAAALNEAQKWVRNLTNMEFYQYLKEHRLIQYLDEDSKGYWRSQAYNAPKERPFNHPFYWGAFTCNGSWK